MQNKTDATRKWSIAERYFDMAAKQIDLAASLKQIEKDPSLEFMRQYHLGMARDFAEQASRIMGDA